MNNLDITFDTDPWEAFRLTVNAGDTVSAARILTLLEGEQAQLLEDALLDLEQDCVYLDLSGLPKLGGTGVAAVRLKQEMQLVGQGLKPEALEPNDPLRLYLEEVASVPVCGDEELLARQCAQDETIRERLTNLGLSRVIELAQEYVGYGVLLLDLIQEGSLGLWQAIVGFSGGDFESFADRRIRGAMARLITLQARSCGVGQKMRQALEDYKAVDERLLSELGRNATTQEIAEQLHMSPGETEQVKKMLDNARLVSRARAENEPDEEEEEEEEKHVEDTALFQMRQRIAEMLSDLPEEDAALLKLRFGLEGGLPLSPEETGRKLKLTPEEVVAREAAALMKLRGN